jgi:hypothetical protein
VYFVGRGSDASQAAPSASATASAAPIAPLSPDERDLLASLIRTQACGSAVCGPIHCDRFSDGTGAGAAAHIAICRWVNAHDTAAPDKCAYAHFKFDAASNRFTDLLMSAVTTSPECTPDPAFNTQVATDFAYPGPMP